jgi:hypothetical protein
MNVMPNMVWKIYRYLDGAGTAGRYSLREYALSEKDFWNVAEELRGWAGLRGWANLRTVRLEK